jgi:hypothetical protein
MKTSQKPIFFHLFFCSILLFGLSSCQTGNRNAGSDPQVPPSEDITIQPGNWENYENTTYGLSLEIPQEWTPVETPDAAGNNFVTNIIPASSSAATQLPLDVHGDASLSYISILPDGLGTEYPSGQSTTIAGFSGEIPEMDFAVNENESKVFQLENGSVWAYAIRPDNPPNSWADAGFIFAQIAVNDFQAHCYDKDSGTEISLRNCDPLEGDRFVREGKIDANAAQIIRGILSGMELEDTAETPGREPIRDLIRVEAPLPNLDIESPYTVKGEAVGYWYFEGSFPVKLYDANDNLLAEGAAEAQGSWMTEDFVPFELTLTFDAPDDERGELVFQRANPSGLAENEREYSLPVIFPPTE